MLHSCQLFFLTASLICTSDLNNLIETPTIFFVCGCPLQAGIASCGCVRFDTIINQITFIYRNCNI